MLGDDLDYRENNSGLQILELEITNSCNLNCKHCYVPRDGIRSLPIDTIKELITQSNDMKLNRLVFSGGEPLLYSGLFEVAKYAREVGIPDIGLLTNGLLVSEKNVEKLKIFDEIQLSIDVPPNHEGIMRIYYTDKLDKKIDMLKAHGINVILFATLSKSTLPLLDELIAFAKGKGVNISFNRLSAVSPELKSEILTPAELMGALRRISKENFAEVSCSDPLLFLVDDSRKKYFMQLSDKPGIKGGCMAGIAALYITSSGTVYPCPFLQMDVGNIFKDKLDDIWENSPVLADLRDRSKITGKCSACQYLYYCGGCRGASLKSSGDIYHSDPHCFKDLVNTTQA